MIVHFYDKPQVYRFHWTPENERISMKPLYREKTFYEFLVKPIKRP